MWSTKIWDSAKRKREKEKLERKQDGSIPTCKYCAEIPENKCIRCGVDICLKHTKYHNNKISSPSNRIFCPDCKNKILIRRIIMVGLTIAGLVTIAGYFFPEDWLIFL